MNNEALPFVRAILESTILALKHFYLMVGDTTIYGKLDAILGQLSPRISSEAYDEEIKKQIASLRKKFSRR
jgi:hypothetical protein